MSVKRKEILASAAAIVLLLAAGLMLGGYVQYILALVAINAMVVLSLDVLVGRLGLISIGHAGFVAIGAYASAVLAAHHWPFILALPVAGILATACGLLLGIPALRLAGFYLAIGTLAFGSVVEQVIRSLRGITGGPFGLAVSPISFFGATLSASAYFVCLIAALTAFASVAWHVRDSVLGRAMSAVKTSEPAAQSIGIDVVGTKLIGFALSGLGAGIAGALYGPLVGFLGPEHFTFLTSVSYLAMAVLGGTGVIGAILGATTITVIPEFFATLGDYSSLVWGVAMLLILAISPRGLAYLGRRRRVLG